MPKKARGTSRSPGRKRASSRSGVSRSHLPVPATPNETNLGQVLRASLGIPQVEASDPSDLVEGPVRPETPEKPPEVRVVSVSSFVPTGHLVCEGCGRIVRWTIPEGPRKELAEVAITSPEGWEVRALAVSFTGYCPACRRSSAGR
ncbi:MAG: hypothetical protein KGJ23_07530 [Euryarchaeota archaeon]|nr:hypothetical protein [Euryarchaeota archaeon]MDE1836450.1 hypothetical protein [Euryarchaeota archaeon]MDE1879035.1 hypothetical protein [Euryarchaeota archaeon]MDE2044198.1 hypothetical protein [Thermoplasmata archaeon]